MEQKYIGKLSVEGSLLLAARSYAYKEKTYFESTLRIGSQVATMTGADLTGLVSAGADPVKGTAVLEVVHGYKGVVVRLVDFVKA